ncbi:Epsin-3 [Zygosaccharomyces mellis]|uniref:Epsin-3 n=1 Tax=Zygosaccharomyces mellis TaxID=42258 RepID=A0A4C2E3E4_9SACH|nr:Epsin-3 [Zygosaccharomyces mellis]
MSLDETLANVSLYDAKKYFRKAQNVVFNYTEMEAKVREATNNEPWGTSSTLMEYIAQGTYNLREREEILGMVFRRFTEKTANEWRQIYKALQLLDYLIKHGSERFIDDTRYSMSLIRMLESFHYIDSQGRDQGINVRSRAKALIELLSDDNKIRAERRKARETSKKYKGVAGGTAGTGNRSIFGSKSKGISVSADYDTDDDDVGESNNEESLGIMEDSSTKLPPAPIEENLLHVSEDGDVEFGEFQCAPPEDNGSLSTTDNVFGSFNSNAAPVFGPTSTPAEARTVTPAIVTEPKKSDPFSSLFSSAKANTNKPLLQNPAQTFETKSQTQEHESTGETTTKDREADNDDNDDLFGDLKAADIRNKEPKKDATSNHTELDLLSF